MRLVLSVSEMTGASPSTPLHVFTIIRSLLSPFPLMQSSSRLDFLN